MPAIEVLDRAVGPLRHGKRELRQTMCRACGRDVWTLARKFNGRCGPCRRRGVPSTIKPLVESRCQWCRRTIEAPAPRKFHAECFRAKTRMRVKVYDTMRRAETRGEEE